MSEYLSVMATSAKCISLRVAVFVAITLPCLVVGLDNGFSRPAMGFNPWNCFGVGRTGKKKFNVPWAHGFNDSVIRSVADAMVSSGLAAAGYTYVNLDCGWTTGYRDAAGKQIVNKTRYPHGMKSLGDYIHSKGLKYGIYSSASTSQCCSKFYPNATDGSLDHERADAQSYVEFGVDYLKFDGCGQEQRSYPAMRDALNSSGRHVVISVNGFDMKQVSHAGEFANSWRTTPDDDVQFFTNLAPRAFSNNRYAAFARPGQFNDPDMLEVGNQVELGNVTGARSHFSLWCAVKSPLIIGTDVTNMSAETLNILTNHEAIAINQDKLGLQAFVVWNSTKVIKQPTPNKHHWPPLPAYSVWAGPLDGGAFTALLLNMDSKPASIKLTRAMLEKSTSYMAAGSLPEVAGKLEIRDLWAKKSLGAFDNEWEGVVEPQGVIFLKLTPARTSTHLDTFAV